MQSQAQGPVHASPDAVDLGRVFPQILRKLPLLALLSLLAGAATAGVYSTMAPQYLSQAQVRVRGGSGDTTSQPDKEAVGTHVRGLMSTELALKMNKALNLTAKPEFNSALDPDDLYSQLMRRVGVGAPKGSETDQDRLMQAYFKAVRAYQVRETRSIIVDCTSANAKFAATCANTLVDLYRESLRGRAVVENSDVRSKLGPEVARLTRELSDAESQAAEFRGKANLFQGNGQATQLKDQQLAELSAELARAATARGEADTRAETARTMNTRGIGASNPDVQKSALVPRMEEQRVLLARQIAELSATLLPGHPRMKQLNSELASLQTQIKAEVVKVVDSLANDARIANDRETMIRKRVDEIKRSVVTSAPDTAKLAQLEAQAKAKRTELERVQRQFEAAASSAGAAVSPAEIEVVSEAYASNEKVFPKVGQYAAFASVGSFLLLLALTTTMALARAARPQSAPQAARRSSEPTLNQQPAAAVAASAAPAAAVAATRAVSNPATSQKAAVPAIVAPSATSPIKSTDTKAVAQALLGSAQTGRGVRVLLTSADEQTPSATEATRIAEQLTAAKARVLVVGWAGSGAALAKACDATNTPGVNDLLQGNASLEEAIQKQAGRSFDLIPAGDGKSAGDADSSAMVLDALDEMYDVIVVHGTPSAAASVFELVQGRFDAGILVTSDVANPPAPGEFLGFQVPDLPVHILAASSGPQAAPKRRDIRTTTGQTATQA